MRRRSLLVLAILAALQIGANAAWLRMDEGVQFTDAAFHYSQVIELREAVLGGTERLAALPGQDERQRYGGLWYGVAAAVSLVTGAEPWALILGLSVLLWPALLLGTFLLGAELAPEGRGEISGLLAAALVGAIPGVFDYSRVLVLDLPLAVAVLWAALLLLRLLRPLPPPSRRRTLIWASVLALVAVAIKANAIAFLAGPAWVAARPGLLRLWRHDRRSFARRLGIAAAAAGLIAAWLLLGTRGDALRQTAIDATWPGKALDYASAGTLAAWPGDWARGAWQHSWEVAYFTILQTFTPPLLAVTIGGYAWFFARRRGCRDPLARAQRDALFWWWALPVAGLLLLLRGLYDERYAIPLLPQAAAVVGVAIVELPLPSSRRVLASAVLLGAALNFAFVSFDWWPEVRPLTCRDVPGWTTDERVGGRLWLCVAYSDYQFMDRPAEPAREEWGLERIEEKLLPERQRLGRPLRAVFLDDLYGLFYRMLLRDLSRSDLLRHEDMLLLTRCWDDEFLASQHGSMRELADTVRRADVVFARWGEPRNGPDRAVRGLRCRIGWNDDGRYRLDGSIPLVDGTQVRWYVAGEQGSAKGM